MNIIIRDDGYINLTQLCKSGGKNYFHWNEIKVSKCFLEILSKKLQIDKKDLIQYQGGSNKERCTFGHPLVATNIAQWISPEFSVNVSIWIEEWKKINNNKEIFNKELNNINGFSKDEKEKEIQLKLQKQLGGEIEVETEDGFIDLLTETEIVEIKNGKNWKHAVGQILIYSMEYPNHKKRIHLFDIDKDNDIERKCKKYDINISYE